MPVGLLLFAVFVGVPLMEIAAFVVIGGKIGLGWTLAMVVITAVIGSALLRYQSFSTFQRIQREMAEGRVPGEALGQGVMIFVAGLLLLTPGFVTDAIGFLLFVPAVRRGIWHFVRARISVNVMQGGTFRGGTAFEEDFGRGFNESPAGDDHVIDLSEDNYSRKPNPDSPWKDRPDLPDPNGEK